MYHQLQVETSKEQLPDKTWKLQIFVTNHIPDTSQSEGYRHEWVRTIELISQIEPMLEGKDFT